MSATAAWENVKQHSRKLSNGRLSNLVPSPNKELKFSKFQDATAPIKLNLDGNELIFENHVWRTAAQNGEPLNQQLSSLKEHNKQLQEENQLLKYKIEVLLDMVTVNKLDLLSSEMELAKILR